MVNLLPAGNIRYDGWDGADVGSSRRGKDASRKSAGLGPEGVDDLGWVKHGGISGGVSVACFNQGGSLWCCCCC